MASLPTLLSTGPETATPEQIAAFVDQYRPIGPVELFLVRRLATQAARSAHIAAALAALLGDTTRQAPIDVLDDRSDISFSPWTEQISAYDSGALERVLDSTLPPPGPIPIRRVVSYAPVPYRAGVLRRRREEVDRQYAGTLRELRKLQARRCAAGIYFEPLIREEPAYLRILPRIDADDGVPGA